MRLRIIIFLFLSSLTHAQSPLLDLFYVPDSANYYSFNGSSSYITIPANANHTWSSRISLEAVFTSNASTNATQIILETVAGKGALLIENAGTVLAFYCGGDIAANSARYNMSYGVEYHVVGLYDGVNTKLYINGDSVSVAATPVAPNGSLGDIEIGYRYLGSRYLNGNIKRLRQFNRALTKAEITTLYKGGSVSGAVYDLNGENKHITSTKWYDATANHNDGVVSGATKVIKLK